MKRTGTYIKDVVGKSVGMGVYWAYKQVDNIKEQLGEPKDIQIEKVMVTVFYTLTPATILALPKEDNSSESETIQSKFMTAAKSLGALGIDLFTLAQSKIPDLNDTMKLFLTDFKKEFAKNILI